jgi:serine/threonine protein kinase/tetratricopeptide (TPR) repeat protein
VSFVRAQCQIFTKNARWLPLPGASPLSIDLAPHYLSAIPRNFGFIEFRAVPVPWLRMSLAPGTKLGCYEIKSPIGAGGMGEVYRATDSKLGRDVALKVLPAVMADDVDRLARFRREAKALAQLDHPNIVTIYSVEEFEGIHFLTMQLVAGLPLDRVIPTDGLPVDQIVDIAGALGDALAAAHEKGIIHRDLKPANVMVSTDGRVKVLDFGLAKEIRESNPGGATMTSANQTQAGMVMGTPAYMSPEQIAGRDLDHRSDIFSLGVLLHEMATGQRPFAGASTAELASAILRDSPASVTDIRPELPADMARIIRRCLEKDPRHRVQTARDVCNEFHDLSRQTASQSQKSAIQSQAQSSIAAPSSGATRTDEGFWVAVLPFKYSGTNADVASLADGISDEIITGMSHFPYLHVIARGSTARYKNEVIDPRTIGKELGARYVIDGNLRLAAATLRVAVQLVDCTSGAQLWAHTYERAFSSETIFALQDELVPIIVSTIADAHGVLPHSMAEPLRDKKPEDMSPLEAVLAGFRYAERLSAEEYMTARIALERAVQIAPGYSYGWAMLSMLLTHEFSGPNRQPDSLDRALHAARRAVELDATNHRAYHALATVHFSRKDFPAFRTAAERAIALNRMDGCCIADMGAYLSYAGDWEHGIAYVKSALELNPHHPGWYWFGLSTNAYRLQDYSAALDFALKINIPGFPSTHIVLAMNYGQLGQRESAQNALKDLLKLVPNAASVMRPFLSSIYQPEMVEHIIDGLRKAGLEVEPALA